MYLLCGFGAASLGERWCRCESGDGIQGRGLLKSCSLSRPDTPCSAALRAPCAHSELLLSPSHCHLRPASIGIIYPDLISRDEMVSESYKIRERLHKACARRWRGSESVGQRVTRMTLLGGNASAEGPEGKGTERTVMAAVHSVLNHHLQETSFTKEV